MEKKLQQFGVRLVGAMIFLSLLPPLVLMWKGSVWILTQGINEQRLVSAVVLTALFVSIPRIFCMILGVRTPPVLDSLYWGRRAGRGLLRLAERLARASGRGFWRLIVLAARSIWRSLVGPRRIPPIPLRSTTGRRPRGRRP